MKDDKAFVYSGVALLLAIPAVILVAALAGMMEIGDTTTSLVIRSDSVFYPCEDIKGAFEFSANNYATVYEDDVNLFLQRFDDRWRPQVTGYFSDAGINISISTINVSFDSSTSSVRVHGKGWFDPINITITDERGDTKCSAESGPLSIPVGEDEDGPTFFINAPANRTYCDTPPFNITLDYVVSEPAFDVIYNLNNITSGPASVGTNILITSNEVNFLTLSGADGLNNNGSDTVYFYVKQWANVSSYNLTVGNISNFDDAKDPSDGGATADIEETSNSSILNIPLPEGTPGEFTGSAAGWSSSTTSALTNAHQGTGPLQDTIYSQVKGNTENGTGVWWTDFDYNFGNISSANLTFDYKVEKFSSADPNWPDNWFNITIVKPDGSGVSCKGGNTSVAAGQRIDISGTTAWKTEACKKIHWSHFTLKGTYSLRIHTTLSTNGGGGDVRVHFDNVRLDIKTPTGYRYQVEFLTLDTEVINWPDHQLEIKYKMSSPWEEANFLEIWDANTSSWALIPGADPLAANTSFNVFNWGEMTLSQYNNGNILVRYTDFDQTDTKNSTMEVDYHRVC
jgi:hypothetical protein